jgi:hypothetical protein
MQQNGQNNTQQKENVQISPPTSQYHYPPPMPIYKPYFIPYYLAVPQIVHGKPMEMVDKLLPTVPFRFRPIALMSTLGLLVALIVLCSSFIVVMITQIHTNDVSFLLFNVQFLMIAMFGFSTLILLAIPKKVGWYFALATGIIALPFYSLAIIITGFGIQLIAALIISIASMIIAILIIISIFIPSTRFYFHTGQFPPERLIHQNYSAQGE